MSLGADEHALSGYLAYTLHPLFDLYCKHLQEWDGEFFPYLWMGKVARAVIDRSFSEQVIADILTVFDHQLGQGSNGAQNLIGVGFVESLPIPNAGGANIVSGYPNLMKQYKLVFGD